MRGVPLAARNVSWLLIRTWTSTFIPLRTEPQQVPRDDKGDECRCGKAHDNHGPCPRELPFLKIPHQIGAYTQRFVRPLMPLTVRVLDRCYAKNESGISGRLHLPFDSVGGWTDAI